MQKKDLEEFNRMDFIVLDAKGWYTKADGTVLMVIARKSELNLILKMIKGVDKEAFLSVGSVMGVYGEGFDKIKK